MSQVMTYANEGLYLSLRRAMFALSLLMAMLLKTSKKEGGQARGAPNHPGPLRV